MREIVQIDVPTPDIDMAQAISLIADFPLLWPSSRHPRIFGLRCSRLSIHQIPGSHAGSELLDSMMTATKAALPNPLEFDYRAAILVVSGDVFQLLGKNAYPLIEWCVNDALIANHEGSRDRLSKRLGFLSIMASYFGASPIEKMSHQIDLLLNNEGSAIVDRQLNELQSEVERFLPALRERLSVAGLHG